MMSQNIIEIINGGPDKSINNEIEILQINQLKKLIRLLKNLDIM